MPSSSQVADDLLAALPARARTGRARCRVPRSSGSWTAPSTLIFSATQRVRVEGGRLLHGGQRHELQQVVLDDVTGGADAVVVAGPAADADVLGHGDLHVVHERPVPDRLEHRVGEAQRQHVLDGLLAEVVVDPEHRVRREHVVRRPRSARCALARSCPNGFSMTARRQAPSCASASPCFLSCWTTSGRTSAGRTGRRRSCRPCPAPCRAPRRRARAARRPSSSSKSPWTNRMPWASCCQTSSRNGVRECSLTASWTTWREVLVAPSRGGRSRRARSPAAAVRGWRGRTSRASAFYGTNRP